MESRRRSLAKALSWRVVATAITSGVAYVLTGKLALAATIAMTDTIIKLAAYYGHERFWNRLRYGRPKPPEYEI